jgi:hypothetical protein
MRSKFLLAAALVAGTASTAAAQLSITPFVGTMIPLKPMIEDTAGGTYFTLTSHTIYGLRASKVLSPTLTLQVQGGIGKGGFEAASGTTPLVLASSVYFVDARLRLRVAGSDATNLGVIAGAGWTQFANGLFDTAHDQDSGNKLAGRPTGIIGLGIRAHLTGDAALTADLTDRIHEQPVEAPFLGTGLIKPLQHDLSMTFGLNFPLGH